MIVAGGAGAVVGSSGGGGSGTVTDVSSTDATNLSVATPTTTPTLTVHNAPSATKAKTATKADALRTVVVSATAPAAGQVLTATGATAADWATPSAGSGTVTDVTSSTGEVGVTTGTTTPNLSVAKVPSAALVAGTHVTIATTAGKAKISSTAPGTGTVTDVTSPDSSVTVATGTTTPKLEVVISKKKTQQTTTPTNGQGLVYTSTAGLWIPKTLANPLNTTVVTGNPSAASELLVSTGSDAASWTATPPGAKKLNATAITGNPAVAGKVLTSTGTDAADWQTPPTGKALWISGYWYGCRMQGGTPINVTYGALYLLPFVVQRKFTATAIATYVTTALASSTVRLGIYGTTVAGKPTALLHDAGTVSAATIGVKTAALATLALTPGVWWLAVVHQGVAGTLDLRVIYSVWAESTMFGLPAATTNTGASFYGWKTAATAVTGALPTAPPALTAVTTITAFPGILVKSA
jgi:hypothetical protein